MMTIAYEYSYFGKREHRDPPPAIRAEAEQSAPMLYPNRSHVFACGERGGLRTGQLQTNPGWIVTFTPITE